MENNGRPCTWFTSDSNADNGKHFTRLKMFNMLNSVNFALF